MVDNQTDSLVIPELDLSGIIAEVKLEQRIADFSTLVDAQLSRVNQNEEEQQLTGNSKLVSLHDYILGKKVAEGKVTFKIDMDIDFGNGIPEYALMLLKHRLEKVGTVEEVKKEGYCLVTVSI